MLCLYPDHFKSLPCTKSFLYNEFRTEMALCTVFLKASPSPAPLLSTQKAALQNNGGIPALLPSSAAVQADLITCNLEGLGAL